MSNSTGSDKKTLVIQFLVYAVVGGISSVADFGTFWVFIRQNVPLVVAATLSFIIATLLNYFLSYSVAFKRGKYSAKEEILRFWLVSLVGLILTAGAVSVLVSVAHVSPVMAKVITLPGVLVWNFIGRRLFVFHAEMPDKAQQILKVSGD